MTLLTEIRELVAQSNKPIILIAVPRWAALHLARERGKELGMKLNQAYADALRYIPAKKNNRGSCVLWLPMEDHPHGGLFILANPGYEAALLIAFSYRSPLLYPETGRTFTEKLEPEGFGGPLLPWRSDQDRWFNIPAIAERETRRLAHEAEKTTRRQPAYVNPSPYLLEVIQKSAQSMAGEETPTEQAEP